MARLMALLLASAAVLALTPAAHAADLLPPPPVIEPPPPSGLFFGNWYLRGDVGIGAEAAAISMKNTPNPLPGTNPGGLPYSSSASQTFNNTTVTTSSMYDIGVGYQFNQWLRTDATLEYRGGARFQSMYTLNDAAAPATEYNDFYRADVSAMIGLFNVYADIGTWSGITPYVGGGVGFSSNRLSGFTDQGFGYYNNGPLGAGGGFFGNKITDNFAWALMAGVDFNVTQNLKLELGYRYLSYGKIASGPSNCAGSGLGGAFSTANCNGGVPNYVSSTSRLASNDVRLGLIWTIDQTPAPEPETPLVRKY